MDLVDLHRTLNFITVFFSDNSDGDDAKTDKKGKGKKHSQIHSPSPSDETTTNNNDTEQAKKVKHSSLSENQGESELSFDPEQTAEDSNSLTSPNNSNRGTWSGSPKRTDSQSSDGKPVQKVNINVVMLSLLEKLWVLLTRKMTFFVFVLPAVTEPEDEFYEPSVTGDTVQLFGKGDGVRFLYLFKNILCKE